MRTIAIILCDNDFGHTFTPLLKSVHASLKGKDNVSEEHVKSIIMEGIRYFYLAFQNDPNYKEDIRETDRTFFYLKKIKILFDKEAEKFIQDNDHDSGSWYLEMQTGNVFPF